MTKKARIEALEREVAALQKRVTELESGRWYMPIAPIPPGEAEAAAVPGDVYSLALQQDDNSLWILTDDSPLTWVRVSVPEAQAAETAAKTDYAAGDLDTEAEVITALNATNTTLNSVITKLVALGLLEATP